MGVKKTLISILTAGAIAFGSVLPAKAENPDNKNFLEEKVTAESQPLEPISKFRYDSDSARLYKSNFEDVLMDSYVHDNIKQFNIKDKSLGRGYCALIDLALVWGGVRLIASDKEPVDPNSPTFKQAVGGMIALTGIGDLLSHGSMIKSISSKIIQPSLSKKMMEANNVIEEYNKNITNRKNAILALQDDKCRQRMQRYADISDKLQETEKMFVKDDSKNEARILFYKFVELGSKCKELSNSEFNRLLKENKAEFNKIYPKIERENKFASGKMVKYAKAYSGVLDNPCYDSSSKEKWHNETNLLFNRAVKTGDFTSFDSQIEATNSDLQRMRREGRERAIVLTPAQNYFNSRKKIYGLATTAFYEDQLDRLRASADCYEISSDANEILQQMKETTKQVKLDKLVKRREGLFVLGDKVYEVKSSRSPFPNKVGQTVIEYKISVENLATDWQPNEEGYPAYVVDYDGKEENWNLVQPYSNRKYSSEFLENLWNKGKRKIHEAVR